MISWSWCDYGFIFFLSNCDCPMRIMMIKVFCSDISCERCVAGALFSRLISERTEELNCHNKCRNELAADDFYLLLGKKFGVSSVATALLFSAYDDSSSAARALKPLFTTTGSILQCIIWT